ncbi:MAG: hypothetical protein IKJ80_00030 [Clostridia bacterium]|nr:hypothetical protein [Clostridia bacterium]
MKKILVALLTLALAFSMAFTLASCNDGDSNNGGEATTTAPVEETTVPTPNGYTLYNNGKISFAYPSTWTKQAGSVDMLINESGAGNNITVSYEQHSDIYTKMDVASFNTVLKPTFAAMGMTTSNVSVSQITNKNKVDMTKISYSASMNGVDMKQTMYVVAAGGFNYIVTVTETTADATLVNNVLDTLYVIK